MLSGLINPGRRLLRLGAAAMLLMPAANAFAGSCKVQNSSPQGQWKFIRAYDGNNGHVVLRQAVNGGDSVEVSVSGTLVRVEFKLPGHTRYKSAPVATCKGGNTIQT